MALHLGQPRTAIPNHMDREGVSRGRLALASTTSTYRLASGVPRVVFCNRGFDQGLCGFLRLPPAITLSHVSPLEERRLHPKKSCDRSVSVLRSSRFIPGRSPWPTLGDRSGLDIAFGTSTAADEPNRGSRSRSWSRDVFCAADRIVASM